MAQDSWYDNDVDYVMKRLNTSQKGLSSTEAQTRLDEYGHNELIATGGISPLRMFLSQFKDPMVIILLVAIALSLFAAMVPGSEHSGGGFIDAAVISAIVLFNSIFGFVQEYKSEQALEALKEMAAPKARVMRDGLWTIIDSRDVVPGDLLGFEPGDRIAAGH